MTVMIEMLLRGSAFLVGAYLLSTASERLAGSRDLRVWRTLFLGLGLVSVVSLLPVSLDVLPMGRAADAPVRVGETSVPASASPPLGAASALREGVELDNVSAESSPLTRFRPAPALEPAAPTMRSLAFSAWLVGALVVLVRLLLGVRAERLIAGSGVPMDPARAYGLLRGSASVPSRVRIMVSPHVTVPMAYGVFRQSIVLPPSYARWAPIQLRAVLLHELGHALRRDPALQFCANVLCAVFWFHPLAWAALERMGAAAEEACDDGVIDGGVSARAYAATLLMVAEQAARQPRLGNAHAMTGRDRLEARLRRITAARMSGNLRPSWLAQALVVALAVPLSVLAQARPADGGSQRAEWDSARLPGTVAFVNGVWYDGRSFRPQTVFARDGRLTFVEPAVVDSTIDLDGGFVIPPLAETHNHNLTSRYLTDENRGRYVAAGVMYVRMMSGVPAFTKALEAEFADSGTIDVAMGIGSITSPGGHPIPLRERLLQHGGYPGFTPDSLVDHAYYAIGSKEGFLQRWGKVMRWEPEFIKVILHHSEQYSDRQADPAFEGRRGLDPEILPTVVQVARNHGLRVLAHVASGPDFETAVLAGVDEIAHLPGWDRPETISAQAAARAADLGIIVSTTASLALVHQDDDQRFTAIREAQARNLGLLQRQGVQLVVGSDNVNDDSTIEATYLRGLGVFDDAAILRMWTDGASAIFPHRSIGALAEGFEASFLVLEASPLDDLRNLRSITMRVKQGHLLSPS